MHADFATAAGDSSTVPLHDVENELTRNLENPEGAAPALRARMSNLVIFCAREAEAEAVAAVVPAIVAAHPARVLLLVGDRSSAEREVTASVNVWCRLRRGQRHVCSEQVTLRAGGQTVDRLPFAVRTLLVGDLPANLWWATPEPPPLAGPLLYDLAETAQQIIYDSQGWLNPQRGVAATASWLAKFERGPCEGRWRVASDLNWRRIKGWRRILAQAFDPATAAGAIESVSEVFVEHGPHAFCQAWQLVGWLASRLGWQVQSAKLKPGVEVSWQVQSPSGSLRVRIARLSDGPHEIRHIRVATVIESKPTVLNIVVQDERRLAVVPEESGLAPRTMTVQKQSLAELVGRQLSDRERDPVFRESMAVARVFADSVSAGSP